MPREMLERLPDWLERQIAQGREFRQLAQPLEIRAGGSEETSYDVEGYATTFGNYYELWRSDGYAVEECVDPHALDRADMSDVIMQYDHHGRVFARIKNRTLELNIDDHGLHILGHLGGTELGRQIADEIRGGYTDTMSWAFVVDRDSREVIEDHETGMITVRRRILAVRKVYDVSAVSIPANGATEIFARGLEAGESNWAAQELRAWDARRKAKARLELKLKLTGGK